MYSDEQIRQLILDMADEETIEYDKAFSVICKSRDIRFPLFALKMLQEDEHAKIAAALNTIRYTHKFLPVDYLPLILPFLDNPLHWTSAIILLRRIGNASVLPRLLQFLYYPDLEARVETLKAIFLLGHPQTFEICLSLIHDSDADIRGLACYILGELRNPLAIEVLIDKLQDKEIGEIWSVNAAAAKALGLLKDKGAIEALKGAVVYGSASLSESALSALWEIEANKLELFYLEQLKHFYDETRCTAIRILGYLGKDDYTDLLTSISQNDPNYSVQYTAAYALQAIGTTKAMEAYYYWYDFKRKS